MALGAIIRVIQTPGQARAFLLGGDKAAAGYSGAAAAVAAVRTHHPLLPGQQWVSADDMNCMATYLQLMIAAVMHLPAGSLDGPGPMLACIKAVGFAAVADDVANSVALDTMAETSAETRRKCRSLRQVGFPVGLGCVLGMMRCLNRTRVGEVCPEDKRCSTGGAFVCLCLMRRAET